ncbi:MAG: hypothetical protein E7425_07845 [Ruminococcaceae bacterium]|nr:hypothetical protein [Oscillospiraceae bacterium]
MTKQAYDEMKLCIMQDMLKTLADLEPTQPDEKPKAEKVQPEKPKAKKRPAKKAQRNRGIVVCDQRALYALADAEMLHTIYAISPDKAFPGAKVWMVEDTEVTRKILAPFLSEPTKDGVHHE